MKKILFVLILATTVFSCTNNKDSKTGLSEVKQFISPAGDSCAEPFLFTDKNGLVYLSWIEKIDKNATLKFSSLANEQWSEPAVVASGNNWFVNWADYPVIITDGNNNLLSHFLEKSGNSTYAYDVKYVLSADNGKTWTSPNILHDDGKQAEHGFVSAIPYNNNYFISWLDGRDAAMMEGEGHEGHHGQMTIRGAILKKDGTKENEWILDGKVCDCCQTSVAITDNGPIVVYRDRSDDEIRDISIVRFENGNWTEPKTIFPDNWKITGCPVNGPRAAVMGNNLAIAWFSMADKKGEVKIIFSKNGGETFDQPIKLDEGNPIGRVAIVMLDENTAAVSWMEGSEIKLVKINSNGKKESPIAIATSAESRSSGFPQMTKSGDKLYFAWTDSKVKTIKVASIKL